MTPRSSPLLMVPILAAALLAHPLPVSAEPAAPAAKPGAELKVGAPAPLFNMKTINPERSGVPRFVLKQMVGPYADTPKRAVVVSFAASYCEPCKRELAELKTLAPRFERDGVALVVVVIDGKEEGRAIMRKLTVEELDLPFPVVFDVVVGGDAPPERLGVLATRYHATRLPMTVVVDAEGVIRWINSGFADGALAKLQVELAKVTADETKHATPSAGSSKPRLP